MAVSNLVSRIGTAVVGIPAFLALLYYAKPWAFYAFIAVAVAIGAFELFAMVSGSDRISQILGVVATLGTSACFYFFSNKPILLSCMLIVLPVVSMLVVLWRLGDIRTAAVRVMAGVFVPLYVGCGLTTLALLKRGVCGAGCDLGSQLATNSMAEGPGLVVLAVGLAWGSDTGGYFAGRYLGKHKLYAAVSPKKTIEGSIGGVLVATLIALLGSFWYLPSLSWTHAIPLAIIGSLLGQFGDLGESLLKRSFNVKDSGHILPGHGGILDRVDALIVTGTVVFLYSRW